MDLGPADLPSHFFF
uniref:Uncharacterized protein n=1 Tax=Rhizophora mucronata TaxID=61149 RepID=A0A2P2NT08_RHIMU